MSQQPQEHEQQQQEQHELAPAIEVYEVQGDSGLLAMLSIAGAIALLGMAGVGFFVALRTDTGPFQLQLMTTVPVLFALGLFVAGWSALRGPRVVQVSDAGLSIIGRKGDEQSWTWDDIVLTKVEDMPLTHKKRLVLYGRDGKALARLPLEILGYQLMLASIERHLAAHPKPETNQLAWRKARRTAVVLIGAAIFVWALSGVNVWMAMSEREEKELLATQAVEAEAIVERKFVAPDRRTHRIEYRIADAGPEAPLENVEIDRNLWAMIEEGSHLPAIAVPGRPDISRLMLGQIDDSAAPSPTVMLVLCAALACLGIVFLVGGILSWRGIEIDVADGRLRINRIGQSKANVDVPATEAAR